jgi:glycosyltransferase involved in cell wall biosynthesis
MRGLECEPVIRVPGQHDTPPTRPLPPDIGPFALFLADRLGAARIVSVGGAVAFHGLQLPESVNLIGFDDPTRLAQVPDVPGHWQTVRAAFPLSQRVRWVDPGETVAVVLDTLDQPLSDAHPDDLVFLAKHAQVSVIAVPTDRKERAMGLLAARGCSVAFDGQTRDCRAADTSRNLSLLILERPGADLSRAGLAAPGQFEVVAFIMTFNEEDILGQSLEDLFSQGVSAYIIDNWSTDATLRIAQRYVGSGVVGIERSPADGAAPYFDLRSLLMRIEELTHVIHADWFIRHDADEIRRSPWPGVPLRDGLYRVQSAGYNCVDFTVVDFPPVDNDFLPGTSFLQHFRRFEFGSKPGSFRQEKAWRSFGQQIDLAEGAGHRVDFPGRRVFPYKFLMRHYSIRSQAHGERKVFRERKERYPPEALMRGWHRQYDAVYPGYQFLRDSHSLPEFVEESFVQDYLIERLTGIGLRRPTWARLSIGPRWVPSPRGTGGPPHGSSLPSAASGAAEKSDWLSDLHRQACLPPPGGASSGRAVQPAGE